MLVIAITGGIASGKSTVANIFAQKYHIPLIDSDQIARDVVKPGSELLAKIISKFGSDLLNNDASLNRKKMREMIFNNQDSKIWLEQLLHPAINKEIRNQIDNLKQTSQSPYCLVMIPLLTKEYLTKNKFIDKVLVVNSSESQQVQRACARDNQTESQIKKIIAEQLSNKQRLELADYIIENNANLEHLDSVVHQLHTRLLQAR